MKKVSVVFPDAIGEIAPEIYGHFSEHIGGVIYGGIWVGKDSKIPNVKGWRKEFIEKFKKMCYNSTDLKGELLCVTSEILKHQI